MDAALDLLAERAAGRLKVREGIDADSELIARMREVLSRMLALRAWDLGAHFAGGGGAEGFDAWEEIERQLTAIAGPGLRTPDAVARALYDVLRRPDEGEAELLADLGRIAFAVAMVTSSPASTMALNGLLPELIYLDANVLMPSILEGHPYTQAYKRADGARIQEVRLPPPA